MATVFAPHQRTSLYHRITIPTNLRPFFKGRLEYWRSLGTLDQDEAKLKAAQWDVRARRVFVTLKMEGKHMTTVEIDALIARWIDTTLEESEDYRAVCGPVSDDYRDGVHLVLSRQFEEASEALIGCEYHTVEKEADELLQAAGLPLLDHEGAEFGRLCRRLLIGKQQVLKIEADRWDGIYRTTPTNTTRPNQPATVVPPGKPFSEVRRLYFAENTRAKRTDGQVKSELDRFIAVLGSDRPVTAITKADCRTYHGTRFYS
jgi:hypothetical protein